MSQPEARLSRKIRGECEKRGAFVFKIHGSPMMMAGVPDLIMCYRGAFVGLETKMPGGRASKVQLHVHGLIHTAGGFVAIVKSVEEAMRVLDTIDYTLD